MLRLIVRESISVSLERRASLLGLRPKELTGPLCNSATIFLAFSTNQQSPVPTSSGHRFSGSLEHNDDLDADVPKLLAEYHLPSVSIAQIQGGKIVRVKVYGQQDAKTRVRTDTLYNLASLTKPITAQAAMRLLSQGTFTLDEPMAPVDCVAGISSTPYYTTQQRRASFPKGSECPTKLVSSSFEQACW